MGKWVTKMEKSKIWRISCKGENKPISFRKEGVKEELCVVYVCEGMCVCMC